MSIYDISPLQIRGTKWFIPLVSLSFLLYIVQAVLTFMEMTISGTAG